MIDPGVHQATEREIGKYIKPGASLLEIGAGQELFQEGLWAIN
jgi:hypothetical protein